MRERFSIRLTEYPIHAKIMNRSRKRYKPEMHQKLGEKLVYNFKQP